MAEDAKERLHSAVDAVLARRSVGDTSARRIGRAVAELVAQGDTGKAVVTAQLGRVLEANKHGELNEDAMLKLLERLNAGWSNAAPDRPSRTRRDLTAGTKQQPKRDLRNVPIGTRVFYDSLGATIRGSRISLDDGGGDFDNVTRAARAVTGQESVNGWKAWRLADGRTLMDAYDKNSW